MKELLEPVDLCSADGRLNPAAIGWARRPLVRANLRGRFGRRKRWDYWCVTDERWLLALLVADLDYLALAAASLIDLTSGEGEDRVKLARGGLELPQQPGVVELAGVRLEPGRLRAEMGPLRAEIEIAPPPGDILQVVVPWSDRRFQLTSKQIGSPAAGRIRWGERTIDLAPNAWSVLDFGRGIWPARTSWNWAAAAGGGIAFNLGARWTDEENALFDRGVIQRLDERVRFGDHGIDGASVALRFTPVVTRRIGWPGVAGLRWSAGRFTGRIGRREVTDLFGWSERFDILW